VHLTSAPAIWYAARASGVAAYVVLTVVVCLGMALGGKVQTRRWPRFAAEDVHRFGGLLVGSLIGLHVLAIAADSFMPFTLTQILVPFTSRYRPFSVGLGIAAAELLVALAITNHYRKQIPYRVWRKMHYANFAVWGAASAHAVLVGTDRSAPWLLLYGISIASVATLALWRAAGSRLSPPLVATAGAVTLLVVPMLMLGLPHRTVRPWNSAKFSEQLTGTVVRSGNQLKQIVSFVGNGNGPQKLLVRADLLVSPQSLDATSLQLEYLPSGDVCRGRVTRVGLTGFVGHCALVSGKSRWVSANWGPADDGRGAVGTISLHA
jgi:hypothetical protein